MNFWRRLLMRPFREQLQLSICLMGVLGIGAVLPVRALQQQWGMVILDSFLVLAFTIIGLLVWRRRYLQPIRYLIAGLVLVGASATAYIQGYPQVYWLFPAVIGVFVLLSAREALVSVGLTFVVIAFPLVDIMPMGDLFTYFLTLMITTVFTFLFSQQLLTQHQKLEKLAHVDPLTQVGNRRAFEKEARMDMHIHQREHAPMSLIILDIDDFKQINDELGHEEGDRALKALSKAIQQRLRASDRIFRIGGEEFAILLRNSSIGAALQVAEYLRMTVAGVSHLEVPLTASFGVAEFSGRESLSRWMSRTDLAMYEAKKNGKNCVCQAEPNADGIRSQPKAINE